MSDFSGQKALVSGATRGIGKAIATALLDQGATVIGLYGGNNEAAAQFIAEVGSAAEQLHLHCCDVSDYTAVESIFAGIEEQFGSIDVLVAAAGIRQDALLALMSEESWRRVLDVNLTGCFTLAKFAIPLMLQQKYGRIIFITSPMGHMGFAGQANYAASKAGQVGVMQSLAKEVARKKITVNCVSPGFIDTDFLADLPDEQLKSYKKMVPARRFGTPDEVADAVLFLAGPKAAYINGSVLEVTGGL